MDKIKVAGLMFFSYFMGAVAAIAFNINSTKQLIGCGILSLVGFMMFLVRSINQRNKKHE